MMSIFSQPEIGGRSRHDRNSEADQARFEFVKACFAQRPVCKCGARATTVIPNYEARSAIVRCRRCNAAKGGRVERRALTPAQRAEFAEMVRQAQRPARSRLHDEIRRAYGG